MSALTIHHPLVQVRPRRDAVVLPFPTRQARRPADPAPPPPLRITRRGRLAVTLLVAAAVAVAGAVLLAPAVLAPAAPAAAAPTQEVVVLPGDTLWGIASAAQPAGADIRDVIAEIRELNAMETSGLTVGQELVVPAG